MLSVKVGNKRGKMQCRYRLGSDISWGISTRHFSAQLCAQCVVPSLKSFLMTMFQEIKVINWLNSSFRSKWNWCHDINSCHRVDCFLNFLYLEELNNCSRLKSVCLFVFLVYSLFFCSCVYFPSHPPLTGMLMFV